MPTERAAADILEAESKGEIEDLKFIDERFVNQSVDLINPLKRLKLGSLTTILKTRVKMKSSKVVQFTSQSDIFGKIAIIQQSRNVALKEVFCYTLGHVPWLIAYGSGDMIKTSKSALMTELEKGATNIDQVPRPFAVVIDGMVMVCKVINNGVTFYELAEELLKYALTSTSDARRIGIEAITRLEDYISRRS